MIIAEVGVNVIDYLIIPWRPDLKSSLSTDADLLGGKGGLSGKYISTSNRANTA